MMTPEQHIEMAEHLMQSVGRTMESIQYDDIEDRDAVMILLADANVATQLIDAHVRIATLLTDVKGASGWH